MQLNASKMHNLYMDVTNFIVSKLKAHYLQYCKVALAPEGKMSNCSCLTQLQLQEFLELVIPSSGILGARAVGTLLVFG